MANALKPKLFVFIRYTLAVLCLLGTNVSIAQKFLGKFNTVSAIQPVDGKISFFGDDGQTGSELWISNGTPEGTNLIKDINPGYSGSSPQRPVAFKGRLRSAPEGLYIIEAKDSATGILTVKKIIKK